MQVEIQISEIEIRTAVQEDDHNNQGLGTDLFIRKNQPGSLVGRGYTIDIFENGVKVDTITEHNKERVLELVKKYKNFYHTNRAFQNEIQLHVTYKRRKDEEKTSMDLSQELYKRANRIQELSQGLLHPYESVRKFADDLGVSGLGEPPIHQITPSESFKAEENPDSIPTENVDSIAKKTIQKLVDYISGNISADEGVLYNDLKAWYKSLGDIINENNTANPSNSLDRGQLTQKIKTITLSGDPNTYKEIDVDVSPEVALKIQEINGKAISSKGGNTKEDAAEGGETTAENMGTAATIKSFLKQAMGEQELSEEDKNLIKQNPNLQNAITQAPGSNNNSILKQEVDKIKNPQNTTPLQPTVQASDFWNFVKTANVVGDLDQVFLSWASGKFASIEEIGVVWSKVYNEATLSFKCANMADVYSNNMASSFKNGLIELFQYIFPIIDNYKVQGADGKITLSEDVLNDYIYTQGVTTFKSNYDTYNTELLDAYYTTEKTKNNKEIVLKQVQSISSDVNGYLTQILKDVKAELGLQDNLLVNLIFKNVLSEFNTQFTTYAQQHIASKYEAPSKPKSDRFKGR